MIEVKDLLLMISKLGLLFLGHLIHVLLHIPLVDGVGLG